MRSRGLLMLLFVWVMGISPAYGQEEPAPAVDEPTPAVDEPAPAVEDERNTFQVVRDQADAVFSGWFVGPLASVMFYDLWFWDNRITGSDAVGMEFDDAVVTRATDEGLEVRTRYTLKSPERAWEGVKRAQFGPLLVLLEQDPEQPKTFLADVASQPVDLAALGLEPATDPAEGESTIEVVRSLAPFAIRVDRATGRTVESRLRIGNEVLPYLPGERVKAPDGALAMVVRPGEDGVVEAHGIDFRLESGVPNPGDVGVPAVVAWLVFGALFFTLRMAFVNLRLFGHAIAVTMGRYDSPDAEGEISHFQALSSALSATVGLGNIAGVAIAVSVGGPGAVVWMVVAGFLGMSSKFVECTLGQMYREKRPDGSVSGGPMHYLDKGLAEMGWGALGKVLAVVFALMCIGGSLGGGNMFQANQSNAAVLEVLTSASIVSPESGWAVSIAYGLILTFLVGLVIIGGIQRIGAAAGLIVPFMCGLYVLAGLFVLLANASAVPAAFGEMLSSAFSLEAGVGGLMGVLIQGFRRAAFSNEAGVGSASIAHSAATTDYPVREGIVALLEPFVDTIVVCTMTGLVVVVTGAYQADVGDGVVMTQAAFGSVVSWFPLVLSLAVVLFAFSTMISWSYYGERCSVWLFGDGAKLPYRILFLACVFIGANLHLGSVLDFSDLMVLGMAFPNILGALLLAGKVKDALDDYTAKLRAGEFEMT